MEKRNTTFQVSQAYRKLAAKLLGRKERSSSDRFLDEVQLAIDRKQAELDEFKAQVGGDDVGEDLKRAGQLEKDAIFLYRDVLLSYVMDVGRVNLRLLRQYNSQGDAGGSLRSIVPDKNLPSTEELLSCLDEAQRLLHDRPLTDKEKAYWRRATRSTLVQLDNHYDDAKWVRSSALDLLNDVWAIQRSLKDSLEKKATERHLRPVAN